MDQVAWHDEALAARAIEKFRDSVGLERWQYSGLIWAADALVWNGRSATKPSKNRESIFQIAVSSNDASASLRLAAFIVSTRSEMLDREVRALIPELGKLDGNDLHYIAARAYNSPGEIAAASKILKDFPLDIFVRRGSWVAFWTAVLAHTDIIANAEKRERAKRHSLEKRQED
jgi:hypothetical protein